MNQPATVVTQLPLSADEFKAALPDKMKKRVDAALMKSINDVMSNPDLYEQYRENLLSYAHVLNDGKFQIPQYLAAVKYVSFKLMDKSNVEAYSLTFPDKIARFAAQGVSEKDVASYVSAYNRSKLVQKILQQTMTPTWVLNQDVYQKAINTLAELMLTAKSEKVRADSAASLLTNLKPPEAQRIELGIGQQEHDSIKALRDVTQELVNAQRLAIQSGMNTATEVASSTIIEGDCEDGELVE
jgi:hypothetical protein